MWMIVFLEDRFSCQMIKDPHQTLVNNFDNYTRPMQPRHADDHDKVIGNQAEQPVKHKYSQLIDDSVALIQIFLEHKFFIHEEGKDVGNDKSHCVVDHNRGVDPIVQDDESSRVN